LAEEELENMDDLFSAPVQKKKEEKKDVD